MNNQSLLRNHIKICMIWIKSILGIFGRTILVWLAIDFFIGNYIINFFGLVPNPGAGVKHDVYHHDLKPSYDDIVDWGEYKYALCTNQFGFRDTCDKDSQLKSKEIDVAFLGDSFTQGVGLDWDKTYVGLSSASLKKLNVANLGVSSYAPSIYYSKLKYLLDKGFKIKSLFVAIDISDIADEARSYLLLDDGSVIEREQMKRKFHILKQFNKWAFPFSYRLNRIRLDIKQQSLDKIKTIKEVHVKDNPLYAWTYQDYPAEFFYGFVNSREALNISKSHMTKLAALAKANNIQLHVVVYPWPAQVLYDTEDSLQAKVWKDFCESNCSEFINTFPDFFASADEIGKEFFVEKVYIPRDVHFNEEGNKFLFEVLKRKSKLFKSN